MLHFKVETALKLQNGFLLYRLIAAAALVFSIDNNQREIKRGNSRSLARPLARSPARSLARLWAKITENIVSEHCRHRAIDARQTSPNAGMSVSLQRWHMIT